MSPPERCTPPHMRPRLAAWLSTRPDIQARTTPGRSSLACPERQLRRLARHHADGGAVSRRGHGARHGADQSVAAGIEGGAARQLDGLTPGAVRLGHDHRLGGARTVGVVAGRDADEYGARSGARDRLNFGSGAHIQGGAAGNLFGWAPGVVAVLVDDKGGVELAPLAPDPLRVEGNAAGSALTHLNTR